MNKEGILIVVSGFSGAGKGTIMKALLERYDNYALSISATTRNPRPGEEEGKAYLKYQNQQHHDWDDFTKDIQIVSQEKSTADNIDEDALAMLEKYD